MNELVYHVTTANNLPSVLESGLRARSYWAKDPELTAYYSECVREEGQEPVVLALRLSVLSSFELLPDRPGLEEPITTVVGMGEEEVWEAWEETGQTWQDCLELIGSVLCASPLPGDLLREHNPSIAPSTRRRPRP